MGVPSTSAPWDITAVPLDERRAIVERFEARVNAAQLAAPPSKEWVRKALMRQGARRCPVRLKRLTVDAIIRYGDALADLYVQYPDDVIHAQLCDFSVGYQPPDRPQRIDELRVLTEPAEWTDEWGTRWGHAKGGVGASPVDVPIKDWSQLDDYLAHRMPDANAPGRLDRAKPILEAHGETKYVVGVIHLSLFERLHCLRGMENTFMDFYTSQREVTRLIEALADYLLTLVRRWVALPISAIFMGDDWGSQTRMLVSLELWRKFFRPHYRRVFDEIHRAGKQVIFHSCGCVTGIIPDLIDLGLDVLDPVQPEAMNLEEVARQFGGKISFSGGIDDQRLEDYSPEEVREAVKRAVNTLGRPFGCGYIGAPANTVAPGVPLDNFRALIETFHQELA
jgi:uroporphyrinogen decarboxylase